MKKVLAFDMDDTIMIAKSPISNRMAKVFSNILENFDICIISVVTTTYFKNSFLVDLILIKLELKKIHLILTCGSRYYRYDETTKDWTLQYAEDLSKMRPRLPR